MQHWWVLESSFKHITKSYQPQFLNGCAYVFKSYICLSQVLGDAGSNRPPALCQQWQWQHFQTGQEHPQQQHHDQWNWRYERTTNQTETKKESKKLQNVREWASDMLADKWGLSTKALLWVQEISFTAIHSVFIAVEFLAIIESRVQSWCVMSRLQG